MTRWPKITAVSRSQLRAAKKRPLTKLSLSCGHELEVELTPQWTASQALIGKRYPCREGCHDTTDVPE